MFTHFDPAEKAVHEPQDRRMYIGIRPSVLVIGAIIIVAIIGAAWIQFLVFGLPILAMPSISSSSVKGFPWWLILCHWVNFFFLIIIIRSGLSILMDHPRLYWNNGCTPGSEWIKFTPVNFPKDKLWTAKDDARYLSPIIGLPGYRHTIGIARGWHFIHVPFFILNGVIFITLLFVSNQWQRVVPASWDIIPNAWSVFVHYATFHMPQEPNGFYYYNALQKISYFIVIFFLAPLAMLSGMCMSPAIENRFHWLSKIFRNRQGARSVHFLVMLSYVVFIIIHVTLVVATGFTRNMNHITIGTDSPSAKAGIYIGTAIVLFTIAFCFYANWFSWNKARRLQLVEAFINGNLWRLTINKLKATRYYKKEDISPYFWINGKAPTSNEWKELAANKFKDYKLKIDGLVENPIELSIEDMMKLGKEQNITMHHCIQGWSGIAEWGGLPLKTIIDLVKPYASAKTVVFYSFGEGMYGGVYYDTHTLENCLHPESILAWEMNYELLPEQHGAPLRLRIENQLGYKQVKWINRIEFAETAKTIGKGYGGKNEDDEYFDLIANT